MHKIWVLERDRRNHDANLHQNVSAIHGNTVCEAELRSEMS